MNSPVAIDAFSPELAASLQDEILSAGTEMERLQRLLGDAVWQLQQRFGLAIALQSALPESPERDALAQELTAALVALQFEDMATQLIQHARRRLTSVVDCLGNLVLADEGAGAEVQWVARACPVAQRAVDAGSVELF